MKITKKTQNNLLIEQNGLQGKIIGIIFSLLGVLAITIAQQSKAFAIILGLIFIISGLFTFLTAKSIKITINKLDNKIKLLFKSVVSKKELSYSFDQIKEVAIEAYYTQTRGASSLNHNLVLYLTDNENILISLNGGGRISVSGISLPNDSRIKAEEIGKTVAEYIGSSYTYLNPPTLAEAFENARKQIKPKKST